MARRSIGGALVMTALALSTLVPTAAAGGGDGAVYTLSNQPGGNAVLVFDRAADGSLSQAGSVSTGGNGTGGGLGSQGALTRSADGSWLYAVNAASDSIALLRADETDVDLADTIASGGDRPTSITAHGNLVYVLNAGDLTITGFRRSGGSLAPLAGSTRGLTAGSNPGQISFSPDGRNLVVAERGTNRLAVFPIGTDGRPDAASWIASPGSVPFGFAFTSPRTLIVSEAATGSASSFSLSSKGAISVIDGAVPDFQAAPCWFVATADGSLAYTTNAGSGSISGYHVAPDGNLSLVTPGGVTISFGAGTTPLDDAVDASSSYLYALLAGTDQIAIMAIEADGSLTAMGRISGLPDGAAGLAAG